MSCEAIRDCLVDYYYRDLVHDRRKEISLHLGSCAECALEYCRLEADLAGLRDTLETAEPGPEVKARLRARVEGEFRPTFWRRIGQLLRVPLPAYQVALFASALFLVFALLFSQQSQSQKATGRSRDASASNAFSIVSVTVIDHVDASTLMSVDPNLL